MMDDVEMKDATEEVSTFNKISKKKEETKNMLPFIEKYRPSSFDGIISHEDILSTINLFIQKKSIPHFLFHGPPGTGKTSCILALAHHLYGDSYKSMTLELNASDDRGINIVREKIKDFCGALSSFNTMLSLSSQSQGTTKTFKLVILDEADMMTSAAQFALRRVIEKYTKNVRFCLICNQVNKIIPAIQSRCMRFRFSPLKKEQCLKRLIEICNKEGIKYQSENALHKIIEIGKGDMRKILNVLESTYMTFDMLTEDNVYSSAGLATSNQINSIIQIIKDKSKSFDEVYQMIYSLKLENGFAMSDLIAEMCKYVRSISQQIPIDTQRRCFKLMAKMDYLDNIGGNEKIIMSNMISAIRSI